MITAQDQMRAKRNADLAYWRQQAALTDEQILKAYCDAQRASAAAQVKMLQEAEATDQEITEYVKLHGTDEG